MGPHSTITGTSFDELFGFDLNITFNANATKATNVKFDINVDSTVTSAVGKRGIVVALIDKGSKKFVAYERVGKQGSGTPLGRILTGSTTTDYTSLVTPSEVLVADPPVCNCGTFTTSCAPSYCPETVQAWHTYFSIQPNGAQHVSVSAFSALWSASKGVEVETPNWTGPFRLGVYASTGDSTHNLYGFWVQVRQETYQIKSRIYSSLYTGRELSVWAAQYIGPALQNPFTVPKTRGPYVCPYMRNSLSPDANCYSDRWDFEYTSTSINQGTPPQWSGGVRSSSEQEFEQIWYFPVVNAGSFSNVNDILIQMHVVTDPLPDNPTDNRVLAGITDASISRTTAGRLFGFCRGLTNDKRLGWIVDGLQLTGTTGFRYYDETLGDNVLQYNDELDRVNLYLTRGGTTTPNYLEIPYDDESPETTQSAYEESGITANQFSLKVVQSRNTVPPGQEYVFMSAYTLGSTAGTFLTEAFIAGGNTVDDSTRRLDGSQPIAISAFQFIGKTRTTEAESEYVIPPGQSSGFSMVAFALDFVQMSCMRREGEPEQWDLCEACNGNNSCVDCRGVPHGTSKLDVCNVCEGNGTSCLDCKGVPFGTTKVDACGVCGGNNSTCSDCKGIPHGTSRVDSCGVCNGGNSSCSDCNGVPYGTSKRDICGVCNGDNSTCDDCLGVPNGNATVDACGVCNGDNSSCCINYLGVYNYVWDWLLLRVSIDDIIVKLRNLYYMLECENANLPWYDDSQCDGDSNENANQIAALQLGDMAATHTDWLLDCLESFKEMVHQWTDKIEHSTPM
eukprot:TRINITY_DN3_c0_g2_i1.p1 TRINITY_DN3_c0_g2~~TRINITY_DN3_c0_g2_i1.p1  ORF type:complete len:912 (-),score=205.46 TRINITY_DN3_c0_g2_i1:208-2574(-)